MTIIKPCKTAIIILAILFYSTISSAQLMGLQRGGAPPSTFFASFNFRETAGFVTDGPNETFVLASDAYPTTRDGITFGWTGIRDDRNRDAGVDRRLAGIHFSFGAGGLFRVDLPSTGNYKIRGAFGDTGSAQSGKIEFLDNGVVFAIPHDGPVSINTYFDATGVNRTEANWPSNNAQLDRTFTSVLFEVRLADNGTTTPIAHLTIEKVP